MKNEAAKQKILEALGKLSTANAQHWTTDGVPRTDVLTELTGFEVRRKDVLSIAPGFTLTNPVLPTDTVAEKPEAVEVPATDEDLTAESAEEPDEIKAQVAENELDLGTEEAEETEESEDGGGESEGEEDEAGESEGAPKTRREFEVKIEKREELKAKTLKRVDLLQKQVREIETEIDQIRDEMNGVFPPVTQAEAIQAHLKSQHEERMQRASSAARLKKLIGTEGVLTVAPVDRDLARAGTRQTAPANIGQS